MTASASSASPTSQPLLMPGDMRYLGSFQVPVGDSVGCNNQTGAHCFAYGGLFGHNPIRNSLFMRGHAWVGGVGEVGIPSDISSAATATVLQDIADLADGRPVDPGEVNGQGPAAGLVHRDRLIVSGSTYYDADGTQVNTHGVSGMDFGQANDFQGWFRSDPSAAANPRSIGGYMTSIPVDWHPLLGGPALTGNCCLSIIGNSSSGPAVSVFDPDNVGVVNPIPARTILFYPLGRDLAPGTTQNEYFNLTTQVGGVVFPTGSRSVLFVGRHGTGPYCYGEGSVCNDPANSSKGGHAYPYRHQIWAYDANDLLAVKSGAKRPWDPRPYAIWTLPEMDTSGGASIAGAAFNPTDGRLYVAEAFGGSPAVHVYAVTVPKAGSVDTTSPRITGLRVAPSAFVAGRRLPRVNPSRGVARLRLSLSEPATLQLNYERALPGRRSGRRCVAPTRQAGGRACLRFVRLSASTTLSAPAGIVRVRFDGRVSALTTLRSGRYRLTVIARDSAGNSSAPARALLTVLSSRS